MRILYVTTIGMTYIFFERLIRQMLDEGHTVDLVCNEELYPVPDCYREWGCKIYHIDWQRNPLNGKNVRAVKRLKALIAENGYDLVHCHTPVAGICARLACRKFRKRGLKVYYTSHGFHFYSGAPLINWLVYYPIEKFCSRYTDVILTINHEDYELAKKKMKALRVEYVPGVGVETERFKNITVDRNAKRAELGIPEDAFVLISVGEVNQNKNHQIIIRALAQVERSDIYYVIAGTGPLETYLKQLAKENGLSDRVILLGFRHDVPELLHMSDVNVFPTIREGLGVAALEGMAAGLPLICADNRGTREYATGYCRGDFQGMCRNQEMFAEAITRLADDKTLYDELAHIGPEIADKFSVDNVNDIMLHRIYQV